MSDEQLWGVVEDSITAGSEYCKLEKDQVYRSGLLDHYFHSASTSVNLL